MCIAHTPNEHALTLTEQERDMSKQTTHELHRRINNSTYVKY